jgi:recombination protein RecA
MASKKLGKRPNAPALKEQPKPARAPAGKRSPAAGAPLSEEEFRAKVAQLVKGAPDDGAQTLLSIESLDDLWSKPRHFISTRSVAIDALIGGLGIPTGRITEIYGSEGLGKSTILDQIIAETQARGGLACLADTEHTRDLAYQGRLGVIHERMPKIQARSIESVFEHLRYWAVKGREMFGPDVPLLYGWDSVAGTPTEAELAADLKGEAAFGASGAKVIKCKFRAMSQVISEYQIGFVMTNQVYKKIGDFYGPEDETYGGGGPKFHSSIRLALSGRGWIRPRGSTKEDKVPPIGALLEVKTTKNKFTPPNRWKKVGMMFGYGIDNGWSLFTDLQDVLYTDGSPIIVPNGSWFGVNQTILSEMGIKASQWQGAHFGLNDLLAQHPPLYGRLCELYKQALTGVQAGA